MSRSAKDVKNCDAPDETAAPSDCLSAVVPAPKKALKKPREPIASLVAIAVVLTERWTQGEPMSRLWSITTSVCVGGNEDEAEEDDDDSMPSVSRCWGPDLPAAAGAVVVVVVVALVLVALVLVAVTSEALHMEADDVNWLPVVAGDNAIDAGNCFLMQRWNKPSHSCRTARYCSKHVR